MARYHESRKDRMDESKGMKRRLGSAYYDSYEGKREQESRDSGMISEDHNQVANLPQEVMMKPWPKGGYYTPENIDDRISGVNGQMDLDGSQARRHMKPKKV